MSTTTLRATSAFDARETRGKKGSRRGKLEWLPESDSFLQGHGELDFPGPSPNLENNIGPYRTSQNVPQSIQGEVTRWVFIDVEEAVSFAESTLFSRRSRTHIVYPQRGAAPGRCLRKDRNSAAIVDKRTVGSFPCLQNHPTPRIRCVFLHASGVGRVPGRVECYNVLHG